MKANPARLHPVAVLLIAACWGFAATAGGQPADDANNAVPKIEINNVPITTVIDNLARTAGINFILDPKLSHPFLDSDGEAIPEPIINVLWTNLPAKQALVQLLKEHNLVMIEDPLTSVTRITYPNQSPTPVDASLLGAMTNCVECTVRFQDAPLGEALNKLTKAVDLDVTLDPRISDPFEPVTHKVVLLPVLNVSWHGVPPRQAIVALCKNYGLDIVKDPATGVVQIKRKD